MTIASFIVVSKQRSTAIEIRLEVFGGEIGMVVEQVPAELAPAKLGQTNLLALNATIEAARAMPAAFLRWWPRRSRRSPARPARPPTRYRTRSPACSLRPSISLRLRNRLSHQGDQPDHQAQQRYRRLDPGCGRAAEKRDPQHRGQRSRGGIGHGRCRRQRPSGRRGRERNGRDVQPDVCFRPGAVRREPASEGRGRRLPRPRPRGVRALTSSFRVGADASPGTTFWLFRLRHDPDVGLRFLPALRVDRLGLVVGD
jgi:hypothetical protein